MADYQKMYLTLFGAVEDLLDRLDNTENDLVIKSEIITALSQAQQLCEELYVKAEE